MWLRKIAACPVLAGDTLQVTHCFWGTQVATVLAHRVQRTHDCCCLHCLSVCLSVCLFVGRPSRHPAIVPPLVPRYFFAFTVCDLCNHFFSNPAHLCC